MMTRIAWRLMIAASVVIVALLGLRTIMFPYGGSHCCLKVLWSFSLEPYAREHGGHFPRGEATPEASLSLLYREHLADANVLRGKTVSLETVEGILGSGELLDPDSCGWHYVEGLTLRDDRRIAIVWDKVGLAHNGQNLFGGHSVLFLDGTEKVIPKSDWPKFLADQESLLAARTREAIEAVPMVTAKVRLPSGDLVEEYDGQVAIECVASRNSGGSGSGSNYTAPLTPGLLRWWQFPFSTLDAGERGTMRLTLTLNDVRYLPVDVSIQDDVASPSSFVFETTVDGAH